MIATWGFCLILLELAASWTVMDLPPR